METLGGEGCLRVEGARVERPRPVQPGSESKNEGVIQEGSGAGVGIGGVEALAVRSQVIAVGCRDCVRTGHGARKPRLRPKPKPSDVDEKEFREVRGWGMRGPKPFAETVMGDERVRLQQERERLVSSQSMYGLWRRSQSRLRIRG